MSGQPINILLLERSPSEARLIQEMLARAKRVDFRVEWFDQLSEGIERLAAGGIDTLLLDLGLPEGKGLEHFLRVRERVPSVPIVVLSGLDDEDLALKAVHEGAQDYLVKKDLEAGTLEHALRYAVERHKADQALRETRARYQSLVESLPLNVFRKDLEGRLIFANQRYCQELGRSLQELLGKTDYELFPRHLAEKYRRDDARVVQTGRPFEDIEEHRQPDGPTIYVQVFKAPVRDATGEIVGIQGMFWDVSARRRAEEALRQSDARFKSLVRSNIIGIVMVHTDGSIIESNDAFLEMMGYTPEELQAGMLRWDTTTPPEYRHLDRRAVRHLERTGVCAPWEKEVIRKDGNRVPVLVGATALEDASDRSLCFVLNMTAQKDAEAQLKAAKEAADAANRAKGAFLANMSHEIRTPMNVILGMSDLLRETTLNAEQQEYANIIQDSAESLLSLINEILDFSKIEASKLELEEVEFDIRDVIGGAVRSLAIQAHRRHLELVFDIRPNVPKLVVGDPTRLRQIVVNLTGNAIKFTEQGEVVVRVDAEQSATDGDQSVEPGEALIHICVADTGIGISQENRKKIFNVFEQGDSSMTRKFGGTGLGLAICAKLAELMGGRIWFDSGIGRGSSFHVAAPMRISRAVLDADRSASANGLAGVRALVVDDNEASRHAIAEALHAWGVAPTAVGDAQSAQEALEGIQQGDADFDLLLVDANMPSTDGFTLAECIKEHRPERMASLLMMLGAGDRREEVARCEELDVAAYVLKPILPSELSETLQAVLTREIPVRSDTAHILHGGAREHVRSLNILLAEDSPYNQKLATNVLEKRGHGVQPAATGREAVDLACRARYDVILMDIQMPEMDGLEAARLIRIHEQDRGGHVPILAMTAQAMKEVRERCLKAGMDGYLLKPIRARELCETVESLAQRGEAAAPVSPGEHAQPEQVDVTAALGIVDGDRALLKDIAEAFMEECPRLMEQMELAIDRGDSASLGRAAHTLKGAVRTFGADVAAERARCLEELAQSEELGRADRSFAGLQSEIAELLPRISELAKNLGSPQ